MKWLTYTLIARINFCIQWFKLVFKFQICSKTYEHINIFVEFCIAVFWTLSVIRYCEKWEQSVSGAGFAPFLRWGAPIQLVPIEGANLSQGTETFLSNQTE
jgi:hypothetical protein